MSQSSHAKLLAAPRPARCDMNTLPLPNTMANNTDSGTLVAYAESHFESNHSEAVRDPRVEH